MSGAGVGLGMGPLAVHARFSQPEEHVAIVSALTLFVSNLVINGGCSQLTCYLYHNSSVRLEALSA